MNTSFCIAVKYTCNCEYIIFLFCDEYSSPSTLLLRKLLLFSLVCVSWFDKSLLDLMLCLEISRPNHCRRNCIFVPINSFNFSFHFRNSFNKCSSWKRTWAGSKALIRFKPRKDQNPFKIHPLVLVVLVVLVVIVVVVVVVLVVVIVVVVEDFSFLFSNTMKKWNI